MRAIVWRVLEEVLKDKRKLNRNIWATTSHTFEPRLHAFVRRFVRYGRGNRILAIRYHVNLAPHPFLPSHDAPLHRLLAWVQFLALWWGYHATRMGNIWSASSDPHEKTSAIRVEE